MRCTSSVMALSHWSLFPPISTEISLFTLCHLAIVTCIYILFVFQIYRSLQLTSKTFWGTAHIFFGGGSGGSVLIPISAKTHLTLNSTHLLFYHAGEGTIHTSLGHKALTGILRSKILQLCLVLLSPLSLLPSLPQFSRRLKDLPESLHLFFLIWP